MAKTETAPTKALLIERVGEFAALLGEDAPSKSKLNKMSKEALGSLVAEMVDRVRAAEAAKATAPKAETNGADIKRPFLLTYKLEGIEATKRARFATAESAEAWASKHAEPGFTVVDIREADEVG